MKKSLAFLISLSIHIILITLMIIAAYIVRHKYLNPPPIQVELLGPAQMLPEKKSAPVEKDPEITERTREIDPKPPEWKPDDIFDPSKIPEIPHEDPRKPKETEASKEERYSIDINGSSYYDNFIVGIIEQHWKPPSLGIIGPNPPSVSIIIRIMRNGDITDYKVHRSSGITALDNSAKEAIESVKKQKLLPGLPDYIPGSYIERDLKFVVRNKI